MRKGGVSEGRYGEFNINPYCGDAPDAVMMNRKALCAELQIDDAHLVMAHQVHGTEARIIAEEFFSLSPSTRQRLLEGVDALITAIPHVCIGVSTADCIPVLLYDEEHHVAAAVHAGWRGTVARVVQKTIAAMQSSFQTKPAHLHACIGPASRCAILKWGMRCIRHSHKPASTCQPSANRWTNGILTCPSATACNC